MLEALERQKKAPAGPARVARRADFAQLKVELDEANRAFDEYPRPKDDDVVDVLCDRIAAAELAIQTARAETMDDLRVKLDAFEDGIRAALLGEGEGERQFHDLCAELRRLQGWGRADA
ncbi:hypothetical protein ACFQU1_20335 [Chelatococcus sp. GCM10030263]|uniref:hypothetical protein n=1 Tax=Chelatococcus sp. GCM10030263 TaxID=3273387 RepID=UPI00361D17D4